MPIRLKQVMVAFNSVLKIIALSGGADLQGLLRRNASTYESYGIRQACVNRIGMLNLMKDYYEYQ